MTRFRLVVDRLKYFLPSEIDTVIPLSQKILQPIKFLSDLTRQLVQFPGYAPMHLRERRVWPLAARQISRNSAMRMAAIEESRRSCKRTGA